MRGLVWVHGSRMVFSAIRPNWSHATLTSRSEPGRPRLRTNAAMTSLEPMSNGVETMFPTESTGRLSKIALPAHLASLGYRTIAVSEYAGEFFDRVRLGFQVQSLPRVELAEITGQMLLARAPLVLAHAGGWYRLGADERFWMGDPVNSLIRGMPNFSHPNVLDDDFIAAIDSARLESSACERRASA